MANARNRKSPFRFRLRPSAAAIMMAFATPLAFADDAQEAALPEVEVTSSTTTPHSEGFRTDSTSSATRTDTPLRDIPQYVNSIPQTLIQSQGAMSLADALRNVPGITYAAAEGGTQASQVFYLRGFPAGGDLFIDGIRDIGEYNRDLFDTESIEVLKGPSALAFGRGSTGGVINQISKRPEPGMLKQVGLTLGSNGEKRLTGDLNLPMSDTAAFRLVALGEDSNTYRDTVYNRQVGVAPSMRFGIGTPTEVTLSYYYLNTHGQTDYGQPTLGAAKGFAMPPVPLSNYYGFADYDYTNWETHIATLRVDHRFSDNLSLRNTLRYANYKRQMEATIAQNLTTIGGGPVTAATPIDQILAIRQHTKARDNDDKVLINQTELTWKVETGAIKHTVLTGLELGDEKLNRWNYTFAGTTTSNTSLLDPDPYSSLNYTKTPNQRNPSEAKTAAIYVQDQVEFSPQWKALAGLRYEYYDAEAVTEGYFSGVPTATGGPFSRVDKMLTGRAGVIWQPTDAQSYYISAGNSYNPSGELGVYGATGTNLSASNDDLDPEENRNYEIGAQWDLVSGIQIRTAIFRNEKTNARLLDPVDGVMKLAGKRRVDGVELSVTGRITPNWDVYSAMAYMDGKIVEGLANVQGKTPLGVPKFSGTIWTVYRLGGGWEVGGGPYASSSWWLDDQNRGKAPSYVRWDAMLGYVQKKYDIRLNVLNVFDEVYYTGGYNNTPNRVIPGQPVTALLTMNYRFD
ncbi:MAG: TonB-dependent siderophore receptor [Betaproteobacteria bacterium]